MSKKPSVDELFKRKLNELPTPDVNEAWQKMKQLLDEKKKRRAFFLLNNYKVVSGALLLLLWLFSLTIFRGKIKTDNEHKLAKKMASQKQILPHQTMSNLQTIIHPSQPSTTRDKAAQKQNVHDVLSGEKWSKVNTQPNPFSINKNKTYNAANGESLVKNIKGRIGKSSTNKKEGNEVPNNKQEETQSLKTNTNEAFRTMNDSVNKHQNNEIAEKMVHNKNEIGSSLTTNDSSLQQAINNKDSLQKAVHADSTSTAATTKTIIKKRNNFFVDAGIQVQQQIPLGTQKLMAYNYKGNKNILLDYIPSLYIRLEKKEQWFWQAEFVYASPRTVKQFTYRQQTQTDYAHGTVATTAYQMQKIFYGELPISFHYYVQPNWSVGVGAAYNWFKGAVAQKTMFISNAQSGSQTLSQQVMPIKNFTDSFFYKSGTSLLLQTDYEKNKWSFGLRYWQDVQPFIAYTLPDGTVANKWNASLQLLIRYRLFRSSSFQIKKR